jgi:hypothetical protein
MIKTFFKRIAPGCTIRITTTTTVFRIKPRRFDAIKKTVSTFEILRGTEVMEPVKLSEVTDLLLDLDSEELEIYIGVASIESMAFKIYIELSARWEPKFGVAFRQGHGTIFEYLMIKPEAYFRDWLDKIHLHMN